MGAEGDAVQSYELAPVADAADEEWEPERVDQRVLNQRPLELVHDLRLVVCDKLSIRDLARMSTEGKGERH